MVRITRFKPRFAAFREIRTSPEMNAALLSVVESIRDDVGGGEDYAAGVNPGKRRSRGYVVTTGWRAMRHEARDHTLLRALAKKAGSL